MAAATALFATSIASGAGERFPEIVLRSFAPTAVHRDARRFQLADFDARRNRVLFYPEGDFPFPIFERHPTALGVLLVHDARGGFADPASYRAYDLKRLVSPHAGGFCGGFLDRKGDFAYLAPLYDIERGKGLFHGLHSIANGLAVKIDLAKPLDDPRAYRSFDIAALGISPLGYCHGTEADGYAYFGPAGTGEMFGDFNGTFLRYDERKDFADKAAWQWFDLKRIDADAAGFQAVAYVAPYVYLVPHFRPAIVRYDTRQPFNSAAAYQAFDLSAVTREPRGLCGVVVAGKTLVFPPLIDPKHVRTIGTALAYDTSKPLHDASAWRALDLAKVHPRAAGYQFGWADRNGFVWLVPDSTVFHRVPPLVAWNSRLPFDDPRSWKAYPTEGRIPPSTGAAYDPAANRAWLAPYGDSKTFDIVEIEER